MICQGEFEGTAAVIERLVAALERKQFIHWVAKKDSYYHFAGAPVYGLEDGRLYLVKGMIKAERDGQVCYGPFRFKKKEKISFTILGDQRADRMTISAKADDGLTTLVNEIMSQIEAAKKPTRFGGRDLVVSGYKWESIGGLYAQKRELKECIEWPLKRPEIFEQMGIKPPHGIILYGPPGTGKTLLAKVVASETKAYFFQASSAELTSKYYGESMKRVRELFKKARSHTPSIIFLDEIDGLFLSREGDLFEETRKIIGTILEELDGLEESRGPIVLGATNRLDDIDPALIRPGRFDRIIEIPLPDEEARKEIFKVHTKNLHLSNEVNIDELAVWSAGMSGAEISVVCQKAAYSALRKHLSDRNMGIEEIEDASGISLRAQDFRSAMKEVK